MHAFDGHIACDAASRSEIVVPLVDGDALIGVFDVDSPSLARFADADRMRAAQVPVEHRHYGSQIHGFCSFVTLLDDGDKAVSEAGATIRAVVKG